MKILRFTEVQAITGISQDTIYRGMKAGTFPQSRKIGSRAVGWLESEILDWIQNPQHHSKKNSASNETGAILETAQPTAINGAA